MIDYVVLFRLIDGAPGELVDELIGTLTELSGRLDGVLEYRVGRDAGIRPDNDDFAIVARFRDRSALDAYLLHPEHLAIITRYVPQLVAEKHAAQLVSESD